MSIIIDRWGWCLGCGADNTALASFSPWCGSCLAARWNKEAEKRSPAVHIYCSTCGEIRQASPAMSGAVPVLRCDFCQAERVLVGAA